MTVSTGIFVILWIICGIIHYGLWFAHFQRSYPNIAKNRYKTDMMIGAITTLLGPIALSATLLCGFYKQGFKWR